ncbi:MAG: Mur ligase family protein [Eubacteriales bacterium]
MKLSVLLKNIKILSGYSDAEIISITDDCSKVTSGCVYVCKSVSLDDASSISIAAVKAGAAAVISKIDTGAQNQVLVENTGAAYSLMCASFFGNPAKKLKLIGVTGTNGKTTTCLLIKNIFESIGIKTGLIGTIKSAIDGQELTASAAIPDSYELHRLLAEMVSKGCSHCVMEVSSQALALKWLEGIHFAAAVFTNLSQNYLDYHGDYESYMDAKHILFKYTDLAIVNLDDEVAEYMMQGIDCPCVTFSIKTDSSNYTAKNIRLKPAGVEYELVGKGVIGRVQFNVSETYSVYNSMGAAVTAIEMGVPFRQVLEALADSKDAPSMLEGVPKNT